MGALRQLAFTLDGSDTPLDSDYARTLVGDELDQLVRMSLLVHGDQAVQFEHDLVKLCFAAKEFGYRLTREAGGTHLGEFIKDLHGRQEFWKQCLRIAPLILPPDVPFPTDLLEWVSFTLTIRKW
jgi:hypothetical protein